MKNFIKNMYTFEDVNAELIEELDVNRRASELEAWVSSKMEQLDLSVVGMPDAFPESFLTQEELDGLCLCEDGSVKVLSDAEKNDLLKHKNGDVNSITARAAQALLMANESDLSFLTGIPEDEAENMDCGEWLQLHQSSIVSRAKSWLKYMKGTIYDLDDLVQEANLAIFKAWNSYEPSKASRSQFCWIIIRNRMRELLRSTLSKKRNFLFTESLDAVSVAHSGFEAALTNGTITWSSAASGQERFEERIAVMEELNNAFETLDKEKKEMLSLLAAGYTQTEIGKYFDRSQAWVSPRVKEGKKDLKQAIA